MQPRRDGRRAPLAIVLTLGFLMGGPLSALSFSAYSFLFPEIQAPLSFGSCAAFEQGVVLTGRAASVEGFAQGVAHGAQAVDLWAQARQYAELQRSPWAFPAFNIVLNQWASIQCHRLAAQALDEAERAVGSDWPAVDGAVADLEFSGVSFDGAGKGLYLELDRERQYIENRTEGPGLGGQVVKALHAVQEAPHRDDAYAESLRALIGPDGVLDRQIQARRDIERVLEKLERDYSDDLDSLVQRLEDGRRIQAQLDAQKIGLVPKYAFSLQRQSDYARTGFVQSFPQTLQSALDNFTDAGRLRAQAEKIHAAHAAGYLGRSGSYLSSALEKADDAASLWQLVDAQTQRLESDLLAQSASARALAKRAMAAHPSAALDARLQVQNALDLSDRPLPETRGERILQLADALQPLAEATSRLDSGGVSDALRSRLDGLGTLIQKAAADGLDVGSEKNRLQQLHSLEPGLTADDVSAQVDAIRESVVQKASERFGRLESAWKDLAPFAAFVTLDVPAFDADGRLLLEANLGHLDDLENRLDKLRKNVDANKAKWLADYLEQHLLVESFGEPVVLDAAANRTFLLSVTDGLDFGADGAVLLKRPAALPDGGQVVADGGIRLLSDGLLLEHVKAGSDYSAKVAFFDVLARTKSIQSVTHYATLQTARRSLTLNFQSDIEGPLWFERNLGVPVHGAVAEGADVEVDNDTVRGVLSHVNKGANAVRLEYDVPDAVRLDKTAGENEWRYALHSQVPFDIDLPLVLDEPVACAPTSKDFGLVRLSDGLYRLSANVTVHAFESKTLTVQLDCIRASLDNQTALLSWLPGLPSGSDALMRQVQADLQQGRYSDATWLLSQLEHPAAAPIDPLDKYRPLRDVSPSFSALLDRAQAAATRGDAVALQEAVDELNALLKQEKSALEEKIKAVCTQCPAAVDRGLHQAKSALFLDDLPQAQAQLASAQDQFQKYQADAQAQNETLHDALETLAGQSWPPLARFDAVWSVSDPAAKWRARQSGYVEAKARHDALQKAVQKLDDFIQKANAGKSVAAADVNASLETARRLASELDALLDREQQDASASVDGAQKAFRQFGNPATQQAQLDAVQAAMDDGRYGAAQYLAESLLAQLQRAPASGPSGPAAGAATGFLGSHSGLEWAAGLGGLVIVAGLAYWAKTKKEEGPLEDIG